jgi:hypothetical protein
MSQLPSDTKQDVSLLSAKAKFCHFTSCSHQEFIGILGSFPFAISQYPRCAENSLNKLATRFWGEPLG